MKTLIFSLIVLVAPQLDSQAQEHTGHGRGQHPRHGQAQQQQMQSENHKRVVIDGDDAEKRYLELVDGKNAVTDLSDQCTAQVLRVGRNGGDICFDRGADFKRGTRYKCYLQTSQTVSGARALMFDLSHNRCGGDGIHPRKVH